ncbi:hypothetical protein EAE32_01960 [Kocuria tytonicola]|uniref:Nucleotidyl transferase AbiEii/AbiGii toxin family protein n=1 Tax=Kocuria tytonicola TaxID=2055946 RepID=A0A3L9L6R6_9MICC|nr:hypothetical protein EAE32_01960 [Kocuria tytonicola]
MKPRGRPATPQAERASVSSKLRTEAQRRGVSAADLRKQFSFALLFRHLFEEDTGRWMVLGGNALLLRTGGGRFTQDVDLARDQEWESPEALQAELSETVTRNVTDPYRITVIRVQDHDRRDVHGYGTKTAKAYLAVHVGGLEFDRFTIDITQRRHVQWPVQYVTPQPVIEHKVLNELPPIPVVPVENHMADKVCAMYERHAGPHPFSTRYRDLADLVRMVSDLSIDEERLAAMLRHEAHRRRMAELPRELVPPHELWVKEYPRAARAFSGFPEQLRPLEASLHCAGRCLNPILSGAQTSGTWDPSARQWRQE